MGQNIRKVWGGLCIDRPAQLQCFCLALIQLCWQVGHDCPLGLSGDPLPYRPVSLVQVCVSLMASWARKVSSFSYSGYHCSGLQHLHHSIF